MKTNPWNTGTFGKLLEVIHQAVDMERSSGLSGEYETMITPQFTASDSLFKLTNTMMLQ